ncbi:ATP-grasp domain-containing protein [Psychrobacter faecalis]|uniref:ATP-grasp domain-containing protein n=1 Tax=Psychrobacter faecalis TaxID=180588 RepID=UPI003FD1060D
MKLAIHHRQGSFSEGWIDYCKKNNIEYKVVNAFDNDIITQLKDCDAFMWHHHHGKFKDVISAKKILFSLEHAGIKVFPNFKTAWHFDDKVAQKYLLEAIDAPIVPSYVFYDKKEASGWARNTTYPKVFKLKGGAGATNVKLVENQTEALKLINKAFGKGFPQFDRFNNLKESYIKYKGGQDTLFRLAKGVGRLAISTNFAKQHPPEKGYAYFQDFIPNDGFDIRVVVIGGKRAAAEKRFVRENDFRASGSGKFSYEGIDCEVIKESFKIANKLNLQSVAFDFVIDKNNKPLIIEMSYGFGIQGISNVLGYWNHELNWHKDKLKPCEWIIEDLLL